MFHKIYHSIAVIVCQISSLAHARWSVALLVQCSSLTPLSHINRCQNRYTLWYIWKRPGVISQTRVWPEVQHVFSASETIRKISKCRRKTVAFKGFNFILTCTFLELCNMIWLYKESPVEYEGEMGGKCKWGMYRRTSLTAWSRQPLFLC